VVEGGGFPVVVVVVGGGGGAMVVLGGGGIGGGGGGGGRGPKGGGGGGGGRGPKGSGGGCLWVLIWLPGRCPGLDGVWLISAWWPGGSHKEWRSKGNTITQYSLHTTKTSVLYSPSSNIHFIPDAIKDKCAVLSLQ